MIVSRSDRFGEGLAVLVRSIPEIGPIERVQDLVAALSENLETPPDLLLCDFDAVGQESVDTLRRVKAQWPHVRCVVLVEDEATRQQVQSVGVDVVLHKGILAARLLDTIEELLSR